MSSATLFDDSWAPVTSVIGFVDAPIETVAAAVQTWRRDLFGPVQVTPLSQGLPESLAKLDPLMLEGVSKEVLLETESRWTAWFDDSYSNGSLVPAVSFLASRLQVFGLVITSIPESHADGNTRWGARQLELYGAERTHFLNYVRTISAINDGGRWRFDATGEVQPFEVSENYRRRRVAERFDEAMLVDYCAALGLRPFDPSFYTGSGVLLATRRPELQRISLAEARKRLGIG